jgi:hypothetical protein
MSRNDGEPRPRPSEETDEALMLRVGRGDRAAFNEIVRRYSKRMVNLAYQITGDRDAAEDLAQETFFRAYRSAARYTQIAKFSTWLYTIAINLCRNELRRRKFKPFSLEEMAEREDEGKLRVTLPMRPVSRTSMWSAGRPAGLCGKRSRRYPRSTEPLWS